jgi:hypothetical protein
MTILSNEKNFAVRKNRQEHDRARMDHEIAVSDDATGFNDTVAADAEDLSPIERFAAQYSRACSGHILVTIENSEGKGGSSLRRLLRESQLQKICVAEGGKTHPPSAVFVIFRANPDHFVE